MKFHLVCVTEYTGLGALEEHAYQGSKVEEHKKVGSSGGDILQKDRNGCGWLSREEAFNFKQPVMVPGVTIFPKGKETRDLLNWLACQNRTTTHSPNGLSLFSQVFKYTHPSKEKMFPPEWDHARGGVLEIGSWRGLFFLVISNTTNLGTGQ